MKFFKEFKEFISKGNILDLAVAVVIGGAFGKIVTSLVNDIIMPLITCILGAHSLSELSVVLRDAEVVDGVEHEALLWTYGNFIQSIIDFLIIAFAIFVVLKLMMKSKGMLTSALKKAPTKAEKQTLRERGVDMSNREEVNKALIELRAEAEQAKKDKEAADKEEAYRNSTEGLLKEIRDLLKDKDGAKSKEKDKDAK
ncbi:MAG: large conductance mechanosensitive channel protein MscL [Clostridia bacterium]|nr:large conductance mechanosensitive channel protein MscL [Clostridia bacterium]